jgi:MFS family permease
LSAPALLATAIAPWIGAALADLLGGYPPVFAVLAGLAVLAAVLAAGTVPCPTESSTGTPYQRVAHASVAQPRAVT